MKCWTCKNQVSIPGDCHITCKNPPPKQLQIGAGGKERYAIAEKQAKEQSAVVRCIWPGCGWYPLAFDGNTVFGCVNYQPHQPEIRKETNGIS